MKGKLSKLLTIIFSFNFHMKLVKQNSIFKLHNFDIHTISFIKPELSTKIKNSNSYWIFAKIVKLSFSCIHTKNLLYSYSRLVVNSSQFILLLFVYVILFYYLIVFIMSESLHAFNNSITGNLSLFITCTNRPFFSY